MNTTRDSIYFRESQKCRDKKTWISFYFHCFSGKLGRFRRVINFSFDITVSFVPEPKSSVPMMYDSGIVLSITIDKIRVFINKTLLILSDYQQDLTVSIDGVYRWENWKNKMVGESCKGKLGFHGGKENYSRKKISMWTPKPTMSHSII